MGLIRSLGTTHGGVCAASILALTACSSEPTTEQGTPAAGAAGSAGAGAPAAMAGAANQNTGGSAGSESQGGNGGSAAAGGSTGGVGGAMGGSGGATAMGGSGGAMDGGAGGSMGGSGGSGGSGEPKSELSFFITSSNPMDAGGNLGGLDGADAHCQALAEAVGAGDRMWRAYLSTDAEDARNRIGMGPWTNANGVVVAQSVEDLHSENNMLNKENSVTESGEVVNGRGDNPNMHDILTGSNADGTASANTCDNWTSGESGVNGQVGHHDREGGGDSPMSWNSAHASSGCSLEDLRGTGGDGRYYCFAADPP